MIMYFSMLHTLDTKKKSSDYAFLFFRPVNTKAAMATSIPGLMPLLRDLPHFGFLFIPLDSSTLHSGTFHGLATE